MQLLDINILYVAWRDLNASIVNPHIKAAVLL
jgi:hypothetical protein